MVCRVGKGVAPIPASGHCRRDATAHPDLETESEVTPVVPDDTYGVSRPFVGNTSSIQALTTSKSIGAGKAPTPPCGFAGVTACLHTLELVELDQEVPGGTLSMGLVMAPGISSISSSCMVKDKATGLTHVDTITTSIGRIVISGDTTLLNPNAPGPTIEDIMDRE